MNALKDKLKEGKYKTHIYLRINLPQDCFHQNFLASRYTYYLDRLVSVVIDELKVGTYIWFGPNIRRLSLS